MYNACNWDSRFNGRYRTDYDLDLSADPTNTNSDPVVTPPTAAIDQAALNLWQTQLQAMIQTTVKDTIEQTRDETRAVVTQRVDERQTAEAAASEWSWTEIMLGVISVILIVALVIIVILVVGAVGATLGRSYGPTLSR